MYMCLTVAMLPLDGKIMRPCFCSFLKRGQMNENGLMQYIIPLHLHNTFEFTNSYNLKVEDVVGCAFLMMKQKPPGQNLVKNSGPLVMGAGLRPRASGFCILFSMYLVFITDF